MTYANPNIIDGDINPDDRREAEREKQFREKLAKNYKSREIWIPYSQFPFEEGWDIRLTWDIREDEMGGALTSFPMFITDVSRLATQGYINVHPFKFVLMVNEKYGADNALDLLKIFLRDNVDNLANKHFRHIL